VLPISWWCLDLFHPNIDINIRIKLAYELKNKDIAYKCLLKFN
jgi:hypothetical protein